MRVTLNTLILRYALFVGLSFPFAAAQTAITLSPVAVPSAGQPGIHVINVTGSGFPSGTIAPANITITVKPVAPDSATSSSTTASAVTTLVGSSRRVSFQIPASISVAQPTSYRVSLTGSTATGQQFGSTNTASLIVNPPPVITSVKPDRATPGTSISVAITAIFTNFVQGATLASFGPGVSVGNGPEGGFGLVTVTAPGVATAQISVSPTASLGFRSVTAKTGIQEASFITGWAIDRPNSPPQAQPGGPYFSNLGDSTVFNGTASTDPDGDPLSFSWSFGDGTADAAGSTSSHTYQQGGQFPVTLTVSDGKGGTSSAATTAGINRPPLANAGGPYAGTPGTNITFNAGNSSDADNDPLTFGWTFGDGTIGSGQSPAHTYGQSGHYSVTVTVRDTSGVSASATTTATINSVPTAQPGGPYSGIQGATFTFNGAGSSDPDSEPLSFTWNFGDGSTGTGETPTHIYEQNGQFTVTLTVRDGRGGESSASTTASVSTPAVNKPPVAIPGGPYSSNVGKSIAFDGGFSSDPENDVLVFSWDFGDGSLGSGSTPTHTYQQPGQFNVTLTVNDGHQGIHSASTIATVIPSLPAGQGFGFLRGQILDDSKALPLAGARALLLSDGSGPLAIPRESVVDERGQFGIRGIEGSALVRIEREGFTSVERRGVIQRDTAFSLLDARLTPLDRRKDQVSSVFGGEARNTSATHKLLMPAGGLPQNAEFQVTALSGQGLQGRLPRGWSPVAAADIRPYDLTLTQLGLLRITNTRGLARGRQLVAARYDADTHTWVSEGFVRVSDDGQSLEINLRRTGQWTVLAPDAAPFTPPTPQDGAPLQGVEEKPLPTTVEVTSEVKPPSAPPGDSARAVGTIFVNTTEPVPSGTEIAGHVMEQFDLHNASQVVPLPFTQDFLIYTDPKSGTPSSLSVQFAITPSHDFTIQELALGRVLVDVTPPAPKVKGTLIGGLGGEVTDAEHNTLAVPAGALLQDTIVDVTPLKPAGFLATIPEGFAFLGAVQLDILSGNLLQGATLSIPRPTTLENGAQVVIAQIFSDLAGVRRLRIVATGALQLDRITTQTALIGLNLPGIKSGGQYVFLHPTQAVGFISGVIRAVGGATVQPLALVVADTAPFGDLARADGAYIVAGKAVGETHITVVDPAGNGTEGAISLAEVNSVKTLDLTLGVFAPTVTSTSPASGAIKIPLESSIRTQFSKSLAPASVTTSAVVLRLGTTSVTGERTLSTDGRTVTFTPSTPLVSNATYSLTLTSELRDLAGNSLAPVTPITFHTVDTSKPLQPTAGQVTALLPDADGLVMIVGTQGTSEAASPVTATNLRSQETFTALAQADGSFRIRLSAVLVDEIALTFRNSTGQGANVTISQYENADGTTAIGVAGGSVHGSGGRIGTILPRALTQAGIFKLGNLSDSAALPALSSDFAYADSFQLSREKGQFNRLASLMLTESQNRFAPQSSTMFAFQNRTSFVVPSNFLVNGKLKFSAAAQDIAGNQNRADGSTLVLAANPSQETVESQFASRFPSVFLTVPKEALPNQQVEVIAVAPTPRVDFEIPVQPNLIGNGPLLLVRSLSLNGETKLSFRDVLDRNASIGTTSLKTAGRNMPGAVLAGSYAVVSSALPLVFVTGRITGPALIVAVEGSPFIFEADEPNASFVLPVIADRQFTLNFIDPATGANRGTFNAQAPGSGPLEVGEPLGNSAGLLRLSAQPSTTSIVDIGQPIVFSFSESVDMRTVNLANVVVTDPAGSRVFGTFSASTDGTRVTFTPSRRWRFGTTFSYGVSTRVLGLSGARLDRAFSGQFTTFTPRIISTTPVDTVRDVAVSGNLALVGGTAGLSVMDVTQRQSPVLLNRIAAGGGTSAVSLITGTSFKDRAGQTVSGTIGLAVSGDASSPGHLQVFNLNTPLTPALLGSTQLTVPSGQSPPSGVRNAPGVPRGIAIGTNQRAIIAVAGVGVESVDLPQAIPLDTANPGRGLGPRYPLQSLEGMNDVAILKDKILAVGASGLTILDANTLEKLCAVSTTGNAMGVAALADFSMDLNGDGTIDPAIEIFDLAVVANGQDGTLQYFNISDPADPILISATRFKHEVRSVSLSRDENLAYVSGGLAGVEIADLAGPASVQPIDLDLNQVDDRILGNLKVPGSAQRIALNLARGIGYVAADSAGLSLAQLTPPRTKFEELLRDPILLSTGDEQSILETREAFVSDDALKVTVNAVVPPQSSVFLAIQEVPNGGTPLLTFANGSSTVPLVNGVNTVQLKNRKSPGVISSKAALAVQNSSGGQLSLFEFRITTPDTAARTLESLFVAPQTLTIPAGQQTGQLSVGGRFSDGLVLNVTASTTGSTYTSADEIVAKVNGEGLVSAVAGGTSAILVANQERSTTGLVQIEHPAVLTGIDVNTPYLTLTKAGARQELSVSGLYSDKHSEDLTRNAATHYTSSNPAIVSVDVNGVLTAVGEGTATIAVEHGNFQAEVNFAAEFWTTPNISAIDLAPFSEPASTARGDMLASATISGTGSLQGVTVTFTLSGATEPFVGITDYSGTAFANVRGLTAPGTRTVTAAVINPTGGASLSDSETLTVQRGPGDNEPNSDPSSASPLNIDGEISGSVGGQNDPEDTYSVLAPTDGTLTVGFTVSEGATPSDFQIVVRSSTGSDLGRFTPAQLSQTFAQVVPAGRISVVVLKTGASAGYQLTTSFEQSPIVITSVSPTSGGVGTTVTITGSGFSPLGDNYNMVLFGTVAAKFISGTPNQLLVQVPANAPDGQIEVIVKAETIRGPNFSTGIPGPLPPIQGAPLDPSKWRLDPAGRGMVLVNRLLVTLDPTITRPGAQALFASLSGSIVGHLPTFNKYIVDFADVNTLSALESKRRQIGADPRVITVSLDHAVGSPATATFDNESVAKWDPGDPHPLASKPYELAQIFSATRKIRQHSAFTNPTALRSVKIAIIDTGFQRPPNSLEFPQNPLLQGFFMPCTKSSCSPWQPMDWDPVGHGTEVTSIIAALNNNNDMSGIFSGLYQGRNEPLPAKVQFRIYSAIGLGPSPEDRVQAALEAIKQGSDVKQGSDIDVVKQGSDIDVVNMSYESQVSINECKSRYHDYIQANPRTLFVVAAGNDNANAEWVCPALLSTEPGFSDNVVSVGAVAVSNADNTGEDVDQRALFGGIVRHGLPPLLDSCDQSRDRPFHNNKTAQTGSWDPKKNIDGAASNCGDRVTLAAPGEEILTINPKGDHRSIVSAQGTSFAAPIVAGVAALLQAIRPTENLRFTPGQIKKILVNTGDDISDIWKKTGDPFRTPGNRMKRLNALDAVRFVLPPTGLDWIYVTDDLQDLGGAMVALAVDPKSGERHPGLDLAAPLHKQGNGSNYVAYGPKSIAFSSVGDVMYVIANEIKAAQGGSLGAALAVVSTQNLEVLDFIPLSGEVFPPAPVGPHKQPLQLTTVRPALALSPDGRLLYVSTGERICIINTLQRIVVTQTADLPPPFRISTESSNDLVAKLQAITDSLKLSGKVDRSIIDLQISSDGKILYIATSTGSNGTKPARIIPVNIDVYTDAGPDRGLQPDLTHYLDLLPPLEMEDTPFSGRPQDSPKRLTISPDGKHLYLLHGDGIYLSVTPDTSQLTGAVINALSFQGYYLGAGVTSPSTVPSAAYDAVADELIAILNGGKVIANAPGWMGVFEPNTGTSPKNLFGSSLRLGSQRSPIRSTEPVYGTRPYGMAIHPDGKRALVSFFQSGNFGVLDLDQQANFANPSENPAGAFKGYVGLTQSLALDNFLSPKNPEDVALLFPIEIRYAQNGKFAAAIHTGSSGHDICASDSANVACEQHGGVSIIDNEAITENLKAHATDQVRFNNSDTSYFSVNPICAEDSGLLNKPCKKDVVTHELAYSTRTASDLRFRRPSGIAIQPFVVMETPRFGDYVNSGTSILVSWRDQRVTSVELKVLDSNGEQVLASKRLGVARTQQYLNSLFVKSSFGELFATQLPKGKYGIRATIRIGAETLSSTEISVTFEP